MGPNADPLDGGGCILRSMFTKPVSQLTRQDLDRGLGVAESDHVEFKRDAYGRRDSDTREFLKDISSMANAVGGFLLIGVERMRTNVRSDSLD